MAAPGGTGPIGPFPAGVDTPEAQEDYDKRRRRVLWSLPYGLYAERHSRTLQALR